MRFLLHVILPGTLFLAAWFGFLFVVYHVFPPQPPQAKVYVPRKPLDPAYTDEDNR